MVHGHRLQRRGHVWKYRRRVPADLAALLKRREFVRSLQASTLREARRIAALLDARMWRVFDVLREGGAVTSDEVERLIECLCDDYLRQLISEDRKARRGWELAPEDAIDGAIDWETERVESKDTAHVRSEAMALLAGARQTLSGENLDALLYELARTRLVALRKMAGERVADLQGEPRASLQAPASALEAPPSAPSPALSEVIRHYREDHEGKTWATRTGMMIKSALAEALQIIGDKPVRQVSKEDARQYRLALDKLPTPRGSRMSAATMRKFDGV